MTTVEKVPFCNDVGTNTVPACLLEMSSISIIFVLLSKNIVDRALDRNRRGRYRNIEEEIQISVFIVLFIVIMHRYRFISIRNIVIIIRKKKKNFKIYKEIIKEVK